VLLDLSLSKFRIIRQQKFPALDLYSTCSVNMDI